MLLKRGKYWYAITYVGDKQIWTNLHQTGKDKALEAYRILQAAIQRERASQTLTDQLMTIISKLASQQITREEAKNSIGGFRKLVMMEACKIIDEWIPAPGISAAELWEKYLTTQPDLKESTQRTKEQRFSVFTRWAGDRDMRTMKEPDCRRFLKSLETEKSQTINNYISDLSSVWKASPDMENPWGPHLRHKSNTERKKAFSREQVQTIISYCLKPNLAFWKHAVVISYYTGLRMKDVVYLSRACLHNGRLELIPEKTSGTERKVSIAVLPPLQSELDSIQPEENSLYYFPGYVKKYERARTLVTREFRWILDATGIYAPGYGFHSLRHTFVTEALNAGIAVKDVQAVVGHEAVELTEGRYYHGNRSADLSSYPVLEMPE